MAFGFAASIRHGIKICTPEVLDVALDDASVEQICGALVQDLDNYRSGKTDEKTYKAWLSTRKKLLPICTFHASFPSGKRKNEDAVPSGLAMFDIDKMEMPPRSFYEAQIKGREGDLGIVLAHVTPSTQGLRLVFRITPDIYRIAYNGKDHFDGSELELAQQWMARQLNLDKYDEACKDYARASFFVPRSYVLYYDQEEMFGTEEPQLENWLTLVKSQNKPENDQLTNLNQSEIMTFKGVPYSDIIKEYWLQNGGEPVEGERNSKLHKLAYHLGSITDYNEELLFKIMPNYGLSDDEMKGLIKSAINAKRAYRTTAMTKVMRTVMHQDTADEEEQLPEMPSKLPSLIELLTSQTPDVYKPAVAHAVFPSLATHLWQCYFRYTDNVEHECTFMNVLMAGTGAGKDCINYPIKYIMADIRARDAINRDREREWKKECMRLSKTKDLSPRPDGLIIQEINPDITNPAFVLRLKEAEGHFLYAKMNEIDQFDSLKGNGRGGQQFQIMCLAFDPDNVYGQTRVGAQSVTEQVQIRFNWNAATTIGKGQQYFRNVLTNGPISRINFSTIPEREIAQDQPIYGIYPDDFNDQLKPYIDRLMSTSGHFLINEANEFICKLRNETKIKLELSQSRVYENLSFRAQVIAWLKSCLLFVAEGGWSQEIEDFTRWSYLYDMECKMRFFGEDIEKASKSNEQKIGRSNNLLNNLPEVFTLQDAERMRVEQNKDKKGTKQMINVWISRGYIQRLEDGRWRKLTGSK